MRPFSMLVLLVTACGSSSVTRVDAKAAAELSECAPRPMMQEGLSVGVVHANGTYPRIGEGESLLALGADRARSLGANSLKVMLTNDYETRYQEPWPDRIRDLASLAATDSFRRVFSGPFETYSILTYSFALGVNDPWRSEPSAELFAAETREIQALAEHLLTTYAGTNKTFILQNWESDWALRAGNVTDASTLRERAARMIKWLNARQAGVNAARAKVGEHGVRVLHSVEVNKVLPKDDVLRAVDLVLPSVCADMVSYSAHEATDVPRDLPQTEADARIERDLRAAFAAIRQRAAAGTPLYISEFGFAEAEYEGSTLSVAHQVEKVLAIAEREKLAAAFYWQIFDNECSGEGTGCRGFWLVRPNGTLSNAANAIARFIGSR